MFHLIRNQNSILFKRCISCTAIKKGYIVLVPEIGEDENATENLIKPNGLLRFNNLTIENCQAAIAKQSKDLEQEIKNIEKIIQTQNPEEINISEDIFKKIEEYTVPLETTWGIAKTIYLGNSTLMPTKSYINIHNRAKRARAAKFSNEILYKFLRQYYEKIEMDNTEEKRLIEKYLLEGNLNGLALPQKSKIRMQTITENLIKEKTCFKEKVDKSIKQFYSTINNFNLVRDFPDYLLEEIALDPSQPKTGPWRITLKQHIVDDFLKYCPDSIHRWNVWQANVKKASGLGDKSLENSTHLEKIRSLRREQAQLLGYKNYAEMSMQTKMMESPDKAKKVFTTLLQHAGPMQQTELRDLQEFAVESGFNQQLNIYDIPYWQRKYLITNYNLNENEIREYFTLPKVLNGLFEISEKLFNIKFVQKKEDEVWHKGVKYFDVIDNDVSTTEPVGGFYLDCYSRENPQQKNFGWMVGVRNRNNITHPNPLSALIFNFSKCDLDTPYLLSMSDIHMIFRNFGSSLQHLLTRVRQSDLAGLPSEWDAAPIVGNVFVNLLNNEEYLKQISGHFDTEESMPDEILKNMKYLQTNLSAYNLCKELYLCDLDLELHISNEFWLEVVKRVWPIYNTMPLDKSNSHPCSMTEIFSGDWGAAYFSQLYSKLVAADIYDALMNDKKSNSGIRFKETFLSLGSSIKTEEVFRRFRGRDPVPEALLKSLNLYSLSQTTAT